MRLATQSGSHGFLSVQLAYPRLRAAVLQQLWAETAFQMQSLRDDPYSTTEEFALIADETHVGGGG